MPRSFHQFGPREIPIARFGGEGDRRQQFWVGNVEFNVEVVGRVVRNLLSRALRYHAGSVLRAGRKNAVVPDQVKAWRWNECGESTHQLQR